MVKAVVFDVGVAFDFIVRDHRQIVDARSIKEMYFVDALIRYPLNLIEESWPCPHPCLPPKAGRGIQMRRSGCDVGCRVGCHPGLDPHGTSLSHDAG